MLYKRGREDKGYTKQDAAPMAGGDGTGSGT